MGKSKAFSIIMFISISREDDKCNIGGVEGKCKQKFDYSLRRFYVKEEDHAERIRDDGGIGITENGKKYEFYYVFKHTFFTDCKCEAFK